MGAFVAREAVKHILKNGGLAAGSHPRAAVLGLTFKEDVPDIRNTRVVDIVSELASFGFDVEIADPMADPSEVQRELRLQLTAPDAMAPADLVVLAVPHRPYREAGWALIGERLCGGRGMVVDVRGTLDRDARPDGVALLRL